MENLYLQVNEALRAGCELAEREKGLYAVYHTTEDIFFAPRARSKIRVRFRDFY